VRSTIPDGIARVLFKMINGVMVLLHGLSRKHRKPHKEIARERAKRY
jgi:hypothetical protein